MPVAGDFANYWTFWCVLKGLLELLLPLLASSPGVYGMFGKAASSRKSGSVETKAIIRSKGASHRNPWHVFRCYAPYKSTQNVISTDISPLCG
jgi:hypothetical protein